MKTQRNLRRLSLLSAIAAIALSAPAWGQSSLLQGGAFTPGHAPMYVGQGSSQPVVQDSGPASGGGNGVGLSELAITARGIGTPPFVAQGTGPLGTIACIYDGPTTATAGYHSMCFSANAAGGGLITYGAGGAASSLPLTFNVNGVAYPFPFSIGGIVGPGVSAVNNAACWNNLVGTLLKDCGAFVTVGGNNTWTGTNNFTSTFQISGTTETFPASGALVGTSDAQTLTNKSIVASQINSGTLPATVMPAFTGGDVTSSAGAVVSTIGAGAVTNAKMAAMTQNAIKGAATSTAVADLAVPPCSAAGNALQWTTNTGLSCATLTNQTAGWGLTGSSTFSISTSQPPYGFTEPVNLGLTASAAGSALTINLTGANGSAPSATNPVSIPFRSATLATGTPVWAAVTSALSIVIPSAATLGTTNSTPFRVWIFVALNGGVPELGVAVCSSPTTIYPCTAWETTRKTTITIDGFATSSGVLYATTGVSNDSVRIIGYAEYSAGLATAGAWASAPTTLQLFGPGVAKPGASVQRISASSSTPTTGNGTTYVASVPSVTITPTAAPNLIRATSTASVQIATSGVYIIQMFRAAGGSAACTTAFGANLNILQTASQNGIASLVALDAPGVTTQQTYTECFKASAANNHVFCSNINGAQTCTLEVEEIQGALPEPANDNINPGIYSLTG